MNINSMMKIIKVHLSLILIICLMISYSYSVNVYADMSNDNTNLNTILEHEKEKEEEAKDDAKSGLSTNDWGRAHYRDGLPWNYFHNKVQADIIEKNKGLGVSKEEQIYGLFINGVKTTKVGRADIIMTSGGRTFIWEVKPTSYDVNPRRQKALDQLKSYVYSDINRYAFGSMQIKGGKIEETLVYKQYTVDYTISYKVEADGLIIYSFTRQERKKEKEQEETVDVKVPDPVIGYVPIYIPSPVPVIDPDPDYVPDYDPDTVVDLTGTVPDFEYEFSVHELGMMISMATEITALSYGITSGDSVTEALRAASFDFLAEVVKNVRDIKKLAALSGRLAVGTGFVSLITGGNTVYAADDETYRRALADLNDAIYDYQTVLTTLLGEDYMDSVEDYYQDLDAEHTKEMVEGIQNLNDDYEDAGNAQPPRDPLIIDLGKTDIELCPISDGVNFDLDNNGFAERTAWIGKEDGFLALDRNNNNKIDNGGELFGDQVRLTNGEKASSGFEALNELDDNENKLIDKDDECFSKLLIWVDENHNGKSEREELKKLKDYDIKEIYLDQLEKKTVDESTGTMLAEFAKVVYEDDTDTIIGEFWFPVNSSSTTHGDVITAGNVPDIGQLLEEDSEINNLVSDFSQAESPAEKRYLLRKILYYITDSSDISISSRGGNIDARNLHVIEQFMGREFVGVDGTNPNVNAAAILNQIFADIEDYYYSILNEYSEFGDYKKLIIRYTDDNEEVFEMTGLMEVLGNLSYYDKEKLSVLLYDLSEYLRVYDKVHGTNYSNEDFPYYGSLNDDFKNAKYAVNHTNVYIGTSGDDGLSGSNQYDYYFGEEGNDSLVGTLGEDYLSGSTGNDYYDGGASNDVLTDTGEGNDTYVFGKGYGVDIISDDGGSNTIVFSQLSSKDIRVTGINDSDIAVFLKETSDALVIKDFMGEEGLTDYTLEFNDIKLHCTDEKSPFRYIYGTENSEDLRTVLTGSYVYALEEDDTMLGSGGKDIIYGNDGYDSIYAGADDDYVYGGNDSDRIVGEDGDDILYGESGNDLISGGPGRDYLFGGKGDDTYYFRPDDNIDIVEDYEGRTVIDLGDISIDDFACYATPESVIISLGNDDHMIISGYNRNPENYFIRYDENEVLVSEVISKEIPEIIGTDIPLNIISGQIESNAIFAEANTNIIAGGADYDYIVGAEGKDIVLGESETDRILANDETDVILGGFGNDQLFGEAGDDTIIGGAGNDYINCGTGNDIIVPGEGNDFIDGGEGDDTYFFSANDEVDSIMDYSGYNRIIFGEGISAQNIKAYRNNWNDLLIDFSNTSEELNKLIIKNYCIDESARQFEFIFEDGTIFDASDSDSPLRKMDDTTNTEYMPNIYKDGVIIVSTEGDDQLIGSEYSDTLIGGKGNNRIIANSGNDYIEGGEGTDYLSGGAGDDVFPYKRGDGIDTISDNDGNNNLMISGYSISDITVYRHNWNDLRINFSDSEDQLIIEGFFTNSKCRNYMVSLDDTRFEAAAQDSPLRNVVGTDDSDYMSGFDDGPFVLKGLDGYDNLNGGGSNDILEGGAGDDRLLANAGSDRLDGGTGNDYLAGGMGDDVYIFSKGYGSDTIDDSEGISTISFGEGISFEQIKLRRTNWNNITLYICDNPDEDISENEDQICVINYAVSDKNRNIRLRFADGSEYDMISGTEDLVNDKNYLIHIEDGVLIISEQQFETEEPEKEDSTEDQTEALVIEDATTVSGNDDAE